MDADKGSELSARDFRRDIDLAIFSGQLRERGPRANRIELRLDRGRPIDRESAAVRLLGAVEIAGRLEELANSRQRTGVRWIEIDRCTEVRESRRGIAL